MTWREVEHVYQARKFKRENNTDIIVKHLKSGIETAKGIDDDFVYITVGEAKIILEVIEELKEYKQHMEDDRK